ncbi:MAG: riboflavin synthase [Candidatus Dormibacteraeota bacterium]|uniref:Riboflavin synthase n=1 Tax=Candidatus Dormiibacter inghamiae TaxID=3127013 RepID=A0A934KF49_9BACT|nr:riboflavin synthase [Candidatus Dormibacteraeota bacterium]MBJ7605192.1 riboflavin synthase [Candidatus Dormibacteraeota bacterium]
MFTGIVSSLGSVAESRSGRLGITAADIAARLSIGASVAVNGVCLTVTDVEGQAFFADVVPETVARTNLGDLTAHQPVNLELPLSLAQGLDGHLVQGHVDAVVRVLTVRPVGLGSEIEFELPAELAPYVAEKASVTLDGTSLTVAGLAADARSFSVAFIPHTLERTIAGCYQSGTAVNLEVDVLARYVERLLGSRKQAG